MIPSKSLLRQYIRQQKSKASRAEYATQSERLCRRILESPHWAASHVVLLYHSLSDEVDTHLLLAEACRQGKVVLLPSTQPDGTLRLHVYDGTTRRGLLGIQEAEGEEYVCLDNVGLVVVPGMAFDRDGHRLGRGRGCYDRLLSQMAAYRIGLCFPWQMVDAVPFEPHDVMMDEVVC